MLASVACYALSSGKRLELHYSDFTRIVEVHAVGVSTAGNPAMAVYQIRGGSVSGERVGWKNMVLDNSFSAHIIDERSEAPRAGYKRDAKFFQTITCQL